MQICAAAKRDVSSGLSSGADNTPTMECKIMINKNKPEWRNQLGLLMLMAATGLLSGYGPAARAEGPEPIGWYAGDMHVHRSCGGPPEAITSLYGKMATHNLAAISLLADMGNGEVQDPATDLPLVNGQDDAVSTPDRIVHWDTEWHWDATYGQYEHQALGGHVVALGLSEADQIWEEYTYPIFNWAHQQNGIAGFAHMQYLDEDIPQTLNCCIPIEYPVEVALGAADFISEDVTGGDSAIQAYYRLLNNGFRPGFAAGTDYPCGVSELGSLLTYVQMPPSTQMNYRDWIEGIKHGRTVVSRNGHNEFLNLTVNDTAAPGDEIKLTNGSSVPVTVEWTANQDLAGAIELVQNGVVVASKPTSVTSNTPANLTATVDFTQSGWLAARRMDSNGHQLHTGAVFVMVNDQPVRVSAADAQFYVQWIDNLLAKTSPGGEWSSYFVNSREAAQTRYQTAKAIYQQIASEATATPPSPPPPQAPLTLQSPNGGEIWNDGSNQTISWTSQNISPGKRLQLYLSTDNGLNWKIIREAANEAGFKTWKLPKNRYASKQALIKVCIKQSTPICDMSDAVFTLNQTPIAKAGIKQKAVAGTEVALDGGTSYDPDKGPSAITYRWTQLQGPGIVLNDADTVSPNFTPTAPGTYVFGLTVNDGAGDSRLDKVKVKVTALQ
jgi:hypothetical protein